MNDNNVVKKDNVLIRTKVDIQSVNAGRILAALIAQIRTDDTKLRDVYRISVGFIPIARSGRKYTLIKNACRELRKSGFEAEEINLSTGKGKYVTLPFFERIEYEEGYGYVAARFNMGLTDFLLNLQGKFTCYPLEEYLVLSSVYSQRMFEVLSSWKKLPEVTITLEELWRELNVPPSFKVFRDFRRRVLLPVAREINGETELKYEWEPIKEGRAVRSIRFVFCKEDKKAKGKRVKTLQGKLAKRTLIHQQTSCSANMSDVTTMEEGIMAQEKGSTENLNARKTFSVLFDSVKEEKE